MSYSNMFHVHDIMAKLSNQRPIFHSEADVQHAFAWLVHTEMPDYEVRLEYRPNQNECRKLDMWINNIRLAIELKYRIRDAALQHAGERYNLLRQGAHALGRYDFLKDVQRLEYLQLQGVAGSGLAIFLTNEHLYWNPPGKPGKVDRAFHIHDGRRIHGHLTWSPQAGPGTIRSRENPINLKGTYDLVWHDYGDKEKLQPLVSGTRLSNARFRYLVVKEGSSSPLDNRRPPTRIGSIVLCRTTADIGCGSLRSWT